MSVHIQPLSGKNLNLVIRVYSGVPDDAPAYQQRLNFDAVCIASFKPNSKSAWVHSYNGTITKADYIDIGEKLYQAYRITEVHYERAAGYQPHLQRLGYRRWRPVVYNEIELQAVGFSGMVED